MQRDAIDEFYRELDATNQGFVRAKFQRGGYAGWKSKHAKQWLDRRDALVAQQHASDVALWTKVGAIGAVVAAIAAALALWLK